MIGTTKYYLGGYNTSQITSDTMWQYERKKQNDISCIYDGGWSGECYFYGTHPVMQSDASKKIALMYASDYGYGASKECTNNLYDYAGSANCKTTNNWLDKSTYTWLLSQLIKQSGNTVFIVDSNGYVDDYGYYNRVGDLKQAVFPVLSLSSNVKISSGEGTSNSPYQLTLINH